MTWFDTHLTSDQREVLDLVSACVDALAGPADDAAATERARRVVADAGLWSIGMDSRIDGGGASFDLLQTALISLADVHPAMAWNIVQAHAVSDLLANNVPDVREAVVSGTSTVSVVDARDSHVRLGGGTIDRIDPGAAHTVLVVLNGTAAQVYRPESTVLSVLRRTGLVGGLTSSAEIIGDAVEVTGIDSEKIRARLYLGAAAIAAGVAAAATAKAEKYARERVQFGGPIIALPTVRAALADQMARTSTAIGAALRAEPGSEWRAATLRNENTELAIAVAASALQTHGGYGYLEEYGVERHVRDAVSLRAATLGESARRSAQELATA